MKKFFLLLSLTVVLTGCGKKENVENASDSTNLAVSIEETEASVIGEAIASDEPITSEPEPEASVSQEGNGNGNIIDTGDYIYVINSWEIIPSKYDENKKVLSLDVTFTNNSKKAKSPWMSLGFKAEQETDVTVEILNGDQIPDDYQPEKAKMEDTDIKPGATVDTLMNFGLLYEDSPVYLRPFHGDDFELVIDITKGE